MIRQLGEGEVPKQRPNSGKTGSKETPDEVVLVDEEIDPADFFDPEEFGFRRGRANDRP